MTNERNLDEVIRENLIWYKENGEDHGDLVIVEEEIKSFILKVASEAKEEGRLEERESKRKEWEAFNDKLMGQGETKGN